MNLRPPSHWPHPQKETDRGAVKSARRFLEEGGYQTMMQHKGYTGKVEFDDEAEIFHGEVIGLRDVITFQGRTVNRDKALTY